MLFVIFLLNVCNRELYENFRYEQIFFKPKGISLYFPKYSNRIKPHINGLVQVCSHAQESLQSCTKLSMHCQHFLFSVEFWNFHHLLNKHTRNRKKWHVRVQVLGTCYLVIFIWFITSHCNDLSINQIVSCLKINLVNQELTHWALGDVIILKVYSLNACYG